MPSLRRRLSRDRAARCAEPARAGFSKQALALQFAVVDILRGGPQVIEHGLRRRGRVAILDRRDDLEMSCNRLIDPGVIQGLCPGFLEQRIQGLEQQDEHRVSGGFGKDAVKA